MVKHRTVNSGDLGSNPRRSAITEGEPDKRAGVDLKSIGTEKRVGSMPSTFRHFKYMHVYAKKVNMINA